MNLDKNFFKENIKTIIFDLKITGNVTVLISLL